MSIADWVLFLQQMSAKWLPLAAVQQPAFLLDPPIWHLSESSWSNILQQVLSNDCNCRIRNRLFVSIALLDIRPELGLRTAAGCVDHLFSR